jgi:hypothetical protein
MCKDNTQAPEMRFALFMQTGERSADGHAAMQGIRTDERQVTRGCSRDEWFLQHPTR